VSIQNFKTQRYKNALDKEVLMMGGAFGHNCHIGKVSP
jgi:hypothetical protein